MHLVPGCKRRFEDETVVLIHPVSGREERLRHDESLLLPYVNAAQSARVVTERARDGGVDLAEEEVHALLSRLHASGFLRMEGHQSLQGPVAPTEPPAANGGVALPPPVPTPPSLPDFALAGPPPLADAYVENEESTAVNLDLGKLLATSVVTEPQEVRPYTSGSYLNPMVRPKLKATLRFSRGRNSGLVKVTDTETSKVFEVYEIEALIARKMDGTRTLMDLSAQSGSIGMPVTAAAVESVVRQWRAYGFLEPLSSDSIKAPTEANHEPLSEEAGQLLRSARACHAKADHAAAESYLQAALEIAPNSAELHALFKEVQKARAAQMAKRPGDTFDAFGEDLADGSRPAFPAELGAVAPAAPTATAPAPAPAPEPEEAEAPAPVPAAAAEPASAAEAPAADWEPTRKASWIVRSWKRLAVGGGAVVTLAALQVIQYPLYIVEPCIVLPAERRYVRADVDGIVRSVEVEEGQPVKKGDLLVVLDDREMKADLAKLDGEVAVAEAEVAKLKQGARPEELAQQRSLIGGKVSALKFAKAALKRTQSLHQQKVASDGALEEAQATVEAANKALSEAQAGLSLLRAGSRPEEIRGKTADLQKLKGQRDYQADRLARLEIRSPIDGTITTPRMGEKKGEAIKAGSDIAEVVQLRTVKIHVEVNEREMDALSIGLPVIVRVASYPTQAFQSHVDFISPAVEEKEQRRFVRVVGSLDNSNLLLRQDMTGYAEIQAGERPVLNLITRRFTRWIRVRFFL